MKRIKILIKSMVVLTLFINNTSVFAFDSTNSTTNIPSDAPALSVLQAGVSESFEDITANWIVETDVSGTSSMVTKSDVQQHSGVSSAEAFTTDINSKAQVRDVISSNWGSVPSTSPGAFIWQRAYVYVPSATANALTGNEYLDLGGLYVSGDSSGFYLRLRASGALYATGPGSTGQREFNLYGTFPLDQWVEVELGLWSMNTGDLDRAGCFLINGKFYGWFTNGQSGTNFDRAAMGIVDTNSADDLTVYIDDWYLYDTGTNPTGTDNRPAGEVYTKDYTSRSGENVGYHYTTWENGYAFDVTHGLSPSGRIQSAVETSKMADLSNGWSQIVIDWAGGNTPPWPPDLTGSFFGPMVAFRKSVELEENLEVVPVYRSASGTVDLVFESWTVGPIEYASWRLPMDGSGHRIPGRGDIIRVRWQEVSATQIRVRVDYFDASAGTWTMDAIDHTRALNNVNGVNFLADTHRAVTNTIDSSAYTIKSQTIGTLATFGNAQATTFADVPFSHPYHDEIEILYANGYTGGCSTSPLKFCPDLVMDRAQSAVFMLRGNFGSGFTPVTPSHFFGDNWSKASWAEGWAESMYLAELTAGCSTDPLMFCPYNKLTNVQAAVFGLRLKYGMTYTPPPATGTVFADMTDLSFWGISWAEQAYLDGLIPACGTIGGKPKFCPNALVNRGFGAYVIVTAKNLSVP